MNRLNGLSIGKTR
jgi:hypothetical protein